MPKHKTILVIDDNKGVLSALKLLLKSYFERIIALPSPVTVPSVLRMENPDVVLLDMNFSDALNSGNEGLYWLHEIKRMHPALPVVLFTAYADIQLAVEGRILGVEGELYIRVALTEGLQVGHGVALVADHVFDGQVEAVPVGDLAQGSVGGQVVFDVLVGGF